MKEIKHEPNYGIVINGMPIDDLDLDDPKTIKLLEAANDFPSGTISKVTFLRRKDKELSSKTKHRSIVIYLKNIHSKQMYYKWVLHQLPSLLRRTIRLAIPDNAML